MPRIAQSGTSTPVVIPITISRAWRTGRVALAILSHSGNIIGGKNKPPAKARVNINTWVIAMAAFWPAMLPTITPIMQLGIAVSTTAISPRAIWLALGFAAVKNAPIITSGTIDINDITSVETVSPMIRDAGAPGSVRRYGTHGVARCAARSSPKLNSAFDMNANTIIDETAAVAASGSSTTTRWGSMKNENARVGKASDPITAIGIRNVSSSAYLMFVAESDSKDMRLSFRDGEECFFKRSPANGQIGEGEIGSYQCGYESIGVGSIDGLLAFVGGAEGDVRIECE